MTATRRELLALLSALAVGGGCRSRAAVVPDGELVDFGRARAHTRLRDTPPPSSWDALPTRRADVAIVGGGVAGLTAAWRLRRAGLVDVHVLEQDEGLGGTARARASSVTAFPLGAHYVVTPFADNRSFTALLDDLGLFEGRDGDGDPVPREDAGVRSPEARSFDGARFHDGLAGAFPVDDAVAARFDDAIAAWVARRGDDGARAFTLPVAAATADAAITALDARSFAAWLGDAGLDDGALRAHVDYACRDDYGAGAHAVSAWAGLLYFCARRREGRPERTVLTWPGGNGALVDAIAARARPTVTTGALVVAIRERGDAAELLVDRDGALEVVRAAHVVCASPRHVARRLVAGALDDDDARWFTTTPWVVVNVHVARHPGGAGLPFAWDTVLARSASLGYVTATHQLGREHGPTVLTWYLPLDDGPPDAARARLLALDRAAWARVALADLAAAHPELPRSVTRVDVARHGHAMIRPVPGLRASGALDRAARPVGRVHFAHTDLSGVALAEEAVFHGVRAAEAILDARGIAGERLA